MASQCGDKTLSESSKESEFGVLVQPRAAR